MPRRGRKHKRRSTETSPCNKRQKKYRKWSEELMSGTIKAVIDGRWVKSGSRSVCQGSQDLTLKDRVSAIHGAKSGPQPYLSYEEEEELVTYLVKCAEIGYPKTKDEVIGHAGSLGKPFTRRKWPTLLKSLKEGAGRRDLWTGGILSLSPKG